MLTFQSLGLWYWCQVGVISFVFFFLSRQVKRTKVTLLGSSWTHVPHQVSVCWVKSNQCCELWEALCAKRVKSLFAERWPVVSAVLRQRALWMLFIAVCCCSVSNGTSSTFLSAKMLWKYFWMSGRVSRFNPVLIMDTRFLNYVRCAGKLIRFENRNCVLV